MELSEEEDFFFCPSIPEPTGCRAAGCRWNGGNCQASGSGHTPRVPNVPPVHVPRPPRVPRPGHGRNDWVQASCNANNSHSWGQPGCNANPFCRWNGRNCVPKAYYSEDEDFDSQDFDLAAAAK
eukprot:scaffold3353_cov144-Skeletonema_menzelii.AAC.25